MLDRPVGLPHGLRHRALQQRIGSGQSAQTCGRRGQSQRDTNVHRGRLGTISNITYHHYDQCILCYSLFIYSLSVLVLLVHHTSATPVLIINIDIISIVIVMSSYE